MNRKRDRERSCLSPKETLRLFMRDSERERECVACFRDS